MTRTDPQLGIRLPGELKDRIRKSAERNRRSMNGEIVFLLEQALPGETNTAAEVEFGDLPSAAADS